MDTRQEVKSLKKALRALAFLNQHVDSTATEVASAISVPRPTAYRILETLASEGYVEKQPHSGIYRITSRVSHLASGFREQELLLEIAKPYVYELGAELGWPISMTTPSAPYMVTRITTDFDCAKVIDRYHLGFSIPMVSSTSGYCYLASLEGREMEGTLDWALREAKRHPDSNCPDAMRYMDTHNSFNHMARFNNLDREEIDYLLNVIRLQGFCNIEHKSYREGNLAVPLLIDGRPVGGLVLRYIKSVLKNTGKIVDFYVPKLKEASTAIFKEYQERRDAQRYEECAA